MTGITLSASEGPTVISGSPSVTRIEVDQLFGLYTYIIGSGDSATGKASRLLLLYGDNGSGKTTLLRMVFSLLSPARGEGHRSFLAQVPFARLLVRVGDDLDIVVTKSEPVSGSSYTIRVTRAGVRLLDVSIGTTDIGRVRSDDSGVLQYIAFLRSLGVSLYFLADNRKGTKSDGDETSPAYERRLFRIQQEEMARAGAPTPRRRDLRPEEALDLAVGRFVGWIRSQALTGSATGELNVNSAYTDVIKRISRPARRGRPSSRERDLSGLLDDFRTLENRYTSYAKFGLVSPLSVDAIIASAGSAQGGAKRIVADVLQPYANGLRARLDALKTVYDVLDVFVRSVNSFLSHKNVDFTLRTGLRVRSATGQPLSTAMLSSGERQLLLLLCNTVVARDQASIFIVDEPEISLNVKWQRKLLSSLLDLTAHRDVQFVIATHSVELLTKHLQSVQRLDSQEIVAR